MTTRILTVVDSLGKGGVQRVAQVFAEAYSQLGIDSKVLAIREGGVREKLLSESGINYWIGVDEKTIQEIDRWNPEIIHLHSHGFREEDLVKFSSLFSGRTVVEKNVFSKPKPWTHQMDISFQMTYWCEWRFRRYPGTQAIKTAIVPNPVNTNAFFKCSYEQMKHFRKSHNIRQNTIVIGRVGQSIEAKWSPLLVKSFNQLRQKCDDLHLLLVNPPLSVISQAEASQFKENITIIDKIIGDKELSIAYSSMDIFALAAAQGESFGNVLAESMLCETPVVALSSPWKDNSQCEVVGHMRGGLIATSPRGFKNALQKLIKDKELRDLLGKGGHTRVIEKYDSISVAKMVLQAIQGKSESLSQSQLHNKVLTIYEDAFDKPSRLSILILRLNRKLGLIRYTSLYESPSRVPSDIFKTFHKLGSLLWFEKPKL